MSTDKTQPSDDFREERIGNYKLIRLLGHGSFANVYLAQDIRDTKRIVAIKILSTSLTDKRKQQEFIEGKILLRLSHEHIVQVRERGVEKENPKLIDIPFIVMDLEGKNLKELYPRGSIVGLDVVVSYVYQLAQALDYAHAEGVIHRDVKPENILQVKKDKNKPDSKDKVRLSDFGIALRPEYDSENDTLGTPLYQAPEQWKGNACAASDQYSLAIVVYEWLYGKPPFEGSRFQLAVQHQQKPPPFEEDRGRNPVVPLAVEQVLVRALAKDPKARYGSVMEFALALETAASLPKQNSQTSELPRIGRRKFITIATISAIVAIPTAIATTEITFSILYPQPIKPKPAISSSASTAHKALLAPYDKHKSKVSAVAWSPDGTRIASGGFDGEIRIWNLRGETLAQYNHGAKVLSIAWDPTGTYIVSVSADGKLRFWNATTRQIQYEYPDNSSVTAVAWSTRKDLVVSLEAKAGVFDTPIDNGFRLPDNFFTGHKDTINALSFSPDSTKVASASDDYTVCLWDEDKGSRLAMYTGHTAQVLSVDWASQLDLIASGGIDKTVQIWYASQTKQNYSSYSHKGSVLAVRWSPNAKYLVSGGADAIARLWHIDGSISDYTAHTDSINGVAFSPDSKFVASASDDGTVRVWEV